METENKDRKNPPQQTEQQPLIIGRPGDLVDGKPAATKLVDVLDNNGKVTTVIPEDALEEYGLTSKDGKTVDR